MRARALLGGVALVGAVTLWYRPGVDHASGGGANRIGCSSAGVGSFCNALSGLSKALFRDPILPFNRASVFPPAETPGAVDPGITQTNIETTICRPGYARSARPAYSLTGPLKRRLMQSEHPDEAMADYELDHLIPISIGGAPLDLRDLWLQPRRGQANAGDKNVLAYVLWRLVCEHRVPLRTAQRDISRDWTKAYELYATPQNVAKYHFRHADDERDATSSAPADGMTLQ